MSVDRDRWERIKRLGEGGQGEVFLVRTPERVEARRQAAAQVRTCIRNIEGYPGTPSDTVVQELLKIIEEYNRPDTANDLGALKEFKMSPDDPDQAAKAVKRLELEVVALQKIRHPAVLRLKHANVDERFIVTEFHHHGTLEKNLNRYKGDALAALEAFSALVSGVHAIHEAGAIHRDIKPENIFVAGSGDLVLGDFGILEKTGA